MTAQARVRQLQETLVVVGYGAMAFGIWSVAKVVSFCLLAGEESVRRLLSGGAEVPIALLSTIMVSAALLDMALRVLIGRAAVREGKGRGRGIVYLVLAFLLAATHGFTAYYILVGEGVFLSQLDRVATFAIDMSSFATLMLMVYSALRLRWLERAERQG